MRFTGFPVEGIEFYEGLEVDNSKSYWEANKRVYDDAVVAPLRALTDDLAAEFGAAKLFRPYRDVRFSADKSPYKTQAGAMLEGGGYVQLSAAGLGVGAGYYMIEPRQIAALREAIADDVTGPEIAAIVEALRDGGAEIRARDAVKSAPRGYPKDHPRIELLRLKGLIAWWQFEPAAWMGTPAAEDRIVDALRSARPLMTWLDTHVGD